jgi:phage shock protein E
MKTAFISIIVILLLGFIAYSFLSTSDQNMDNSLDISPQKFSEMVNSNRGIIIDVRTDEEYKNGHLAMADHQFNLMDGEFESKLDSLSKDETYYLYCRTGNRSGQAARLMKENGFENVYNVGGFSELAAKGFETE